MDVVTAFLKSKSFFKEYTRQYNTSRTSMVIIQIDDERKIVNEERK